jgi:hypothetical protein
MKVVIPFVWPTVRLASSGWEHCSNESIHTDRRMVVDDLVWTSTILMRSLEVDQAIDELVLTDR